MRQHTPLHGFVAPGFEPVQVEFARNFAERGELGAACTIYLKGEKVVDLWGGYRDIQKQKPWEENTLVLVFSSSKGLSALACAVAHSRGYFSYDAPVAQYWPEFAQNGKEHITIRQLLAHEAGLAVIEEPLTLDILAHPDELAKILARQRPLWEPGTRHGYHAFSLGWYESELIRRTDPHKRTLGRFFHDELAVPLGLEFYIGLPPDIPDERIATVTEPGIISKLLGMPKGMMLSALNPHSLVVRTANPRIRSNLILNTPPFRAVEIPSAGGIGQASSIAHAYSVFATEGKELGLTERTLAELRAPATPPREGWRDVILARDMAYALGFLKPFSGYHFGSSPAAYGGPGSGGSFGFADPDAQVGYAYVMNHQGIRVLDEPREKILRDTFYKCLAGRTL
ncbi:MAG TPA: serine hydrolase domain-containing protein [Ktedonobacteraceae bacterium]|nr:serine hydrolase domain-containing protein [Ktedonobacteraceae bacterium]